MSRERTFRLADSAVVEPLVGKWSAWSHLISPPAASLHLLHYQIKTLRSYLDNPAAHLEALRNPEMKGGPFVDVPVERADEVGRLLRDTEEGRAADLRLARGIIEFHNRLVDEADGQSLEPYYRKMPGALRGYVELVYDYYNRPAVRFMENMLYRSEHYNEGLQSLRIFQLWRDEARPFFMSTPRLPDGGQIDWPVPFADPLADEFFKLDVEGQPLGRVRELLGLSLADDERLRQLLTEESFVAPEPPSPGTLRLRYLGHACVLAEWNGVTVMTDPYVAARPAGGGLTRLSYGDLPERIDYALVTHSHHDHFVLETLLRLRHRIGCVVVPKAYGILHGDTSLKLMLQRLGFSHVVELDTLESIPLPGGEIIAAPFLGEHSDVAHGKAAYVIRAGREQVLFAADSACLDEYIYENLRRVLGRIETVFLGMECVGAPLSWHCGPLLLRAPRRDHDQSRRSHGCDSAAGLSLLETVGARRFYNYAMGQEPWLEHLLGLGLSADSTQIKESERLLAETRARGFLAAERLYGARDILLDVASEKNRAFVAQPGVADDETEPDADGSHDFVETRDAEDHFVF
jgi:L-ascorbate metabolism protein UlaG (beta-lactamase superfamily)